MDDEPAHVVGLDFGRRLSIVDFSAECGRSSGVSGLSQVFPPDHALYAMSLAQIGVIICRHRDEDTVSTVPRWAGTSLRVGRAVVCANAVRPDKPYA